MDQIKTRERRLRQDVPIIDLSDTDDDSTSRKRKGSDIGSDDDYVPKGEKNDTKKLKATVARKRKVVSSNKSDEAAELNSKETKKEKLVSNSSRKQAQSEHLSDEDGPSKQTKSRVTKKAKYEDDDNLSSFKTEKMQHLQMNWDESEYLADVEGIDPRVASAVIRLFNEENTIPFIARYRKEMTQNMTPEKLRHVKESYDTIKSIKHRADVITKAIKKVDKLTPQIEYSIKCARDLHELEHIYAPYKPGTKRELAAKARALGLEPAALILLDGKEELYLETLIDKKTKGLETVDAVQKGIQHIIADLISKDTALLAFIRTLLKKAHILVESKKAATRSKALKDEAKPSKSQSENSDKFSDYFNFSIPLKFIKPHQVLALNRGEKLKELSVKINIPSRVENEITQFCESKWIRCGKMYSYRLKVLNDSVKDSYNRLIVPLITRQVRGELNKEAERESIEVFARNLKSLLLTPPYKGHPVLAIDPGFKNGCKIALVSSTGALLDYCVMNMSSASFYRDTKSNDYLRDIMLKHNCELIAIGNGHGCREAEQYVSSLINSNIFKPLNVQYTFIDEQGTSIYSCSEEASKEFPKLDPTIISAVSLARRLQDPLSEMVKVEPKHLGVGMYQHDMPEKMLLSTLQEVVIECVSFVGVDLNTAPHCLLKQIAGLGSAKADQILEWREKNGSFFNRDQLNEVKGIGKKSYEQCAGFVRILPDTVSPDQRWKLNALDRTWIHPESYPFAKKFAEDNDIDLNDLGSQNFRDKVQRAVDAAGGENGVASKYKVTPTLADLVIRGLLAPVNQDFRSQFQKPIFRKGVVSVNDLKEGIQVTGRVTNTTSFGAFVDVGVGRDGLLHVSGMKGQTINLNDHVEVMVKNIDLNRGRISFILVKKL